MTLTSTSPGPFTRGRLVVQDAEEAFDLDDGLRELRLRLVQSRADLLDEGIRDGVEFYDERLRRLKKLRRRLGQLMDEKGWGVLEDVE